jgi:hypothetical protein
VFTVRYELDFYIPEDGILNSQRRKTLKSYMIIFSFLVGSRTHDLPACSVVSEGAPMYLSVSG